MSHISEVSTFPIDTTHCDIELVFDCFVFSYSWVALWDYPYGDEACVIFSYTPLNYGANEVRDTYPTCRCL